MEIPEKRLAEEEEEDISGRTQASADKPVWKWTMRSPEAAGTLAGVMGQGGGAGGSSAGSREGRSLSLA